MGKINELAISDSNVNMNIVEKYGTFRLQSDKQITENGKHTADVGFNGLSSVNVNVSGSADLEDDKTVSITENGVVEITPSAGKDGMKKVTATVNVSGGGDLENNKEVTINVSAYTDPVEITPTQGKDGMKKVTVSLSNIPAGANMLYAWSNTSEIIYSPYNVPPAEFTEFNSLPIMAAEQTSDVYAITKRDTQSAHGYSKVSDTEFSVVWVDRGDAVTYIRDATKDVEIWNAPPEVETTKQATIDVSTYDPANKPVIVPTVGKQSMGSVEVTLSNIPSGGSSTLYAFKTWDSSDWGYDVYFCDKKNPSVGDTMVYINSDGSYNKSDVISIEGDLINIGDITVKRYPDNDITF